MANDETLKFRELLAEKLGNATRFELIELIDLLVSLKRPVDEEDIANYFGVEVI